MNNLTPEQRNAVIEFAKQHGANWKEKLAEGWERSAYPGLLQEVRNDLGPEWLAEMTLPTVYDTFEYSVCEDCLMFLANDDVPEDKDHAFYCGKIAGELNGRRGHFSIGVDPTEDDPEGSGYEEFSNQGCELCNDHLAGSRHGATLFVEVAL